MDSSPKGDCSRDLCRQMDVPFYTRNQGFVLTASGEDSSRQAAPTAEE
jgi:hypothetical protein